MTPEEAFEFVNGLFIEKKQPSLSKSEQDIFIGIYRDLKYREMEAEIYKSPSHIRASGPKLFKKIKETLEIKIDKYNFVPAIEQLWKQHSEKSQISQKPLTELTNPAVEEILPPASPLQPQANLIAENDLINPFIPLSGRIDYPQYFFNRHREIKKVFELLNSHSNVALIGKEGMGKSSLLLEILRQSANRLLSPRRPVYINLLLVKNEVEFYSKLCEKIDIPNNQGLDLNCALEQHRLLLLIDPAGKMKSEGFTRQLRDHLRGLAEEIDAPLRLILATDEPLDQLFQDGSTASPFSGIFQQEDLKPWDEVTARAFIESRLETTSVRFTEEEITQLVQESAGHPRRLMQLCYQTYARYMEQVQ